MTQLRPTRAEIDLGAIRHNVAAMGERRQDAEHLLDKAKQTSPQLNSSNALLREMLRQRTVRA